jgi:hypothetical protein
MKNLLLIFVLLLSFTQTASAFAIRAEVQVTPLAITAKVFNYLNRAVICDIQTFGYRRYAQPIQAWADNIIIHPGQIGYAYINTNYYNAFYSGNASANCIWY